MDDQNITHWSYQAIEGPDAFELAAAQYLDRDPRPEVGFTLFGWGFASDDVKERANGSVDFETARKYFPEIDWEKHGRSLQDRNFAEPHLRVRVWLSAVRTGEGDRRWIQFRGFLAGTIILVTGKMHLDSRSGDLQLWKAASPLLLI